jgi:hypothetical protein
MCRYGLDEATAHYVPQVVDNPDTSIASAGAPKPEE